MKIKASLPNGSGGELEVSPKDLSAFQRFFKNVTPDFIKVKFAILSDNARFDRWKNIIRINNEASEIAKKNKIKSIPLSLKDTVLFLESASLEDDPELQSMWAYLLANSSSLNRTTIFINLLKELNSADAKFLQFCFNKVKNISRDDNFRFNLSKVDIQKTLEINNVEFMIILDNLNRLGLIQKPIIPKTAPSPFIPPSTGIRFDGQNDSQDALVKYLDDEAELFGIAESKIQLTTLGFELLKVCNNS